MPCSNKERELIIMLDANVVAAEHAKFHAERMPIVLHKSPERVAEAIAWTGAYCRDVLPGILVDRASVKRDDDFDGYDQ